MLDFQLTNSEYLFLFGIIALFIIGIYIIGWWKVLINQKREKQAREMSEYLSDMIEFRVGNPVNALAMYVNTLKGHARTLAIYKLIRLATHKDNLVAFLVLRDRIPSKALKHTLKYWGDGDLKAWVHGTEIGRLNGMKLVCFALGLRTIEHLDSRLTKVECNELSRLGIPQPLKEADAAAG